MNDTKYLLKIDTDSYAGNFERPLIAFVTGIVDTDGEEEAKLALKELTDEQFEWIEDHVIEDYYDESYPEIAIILPTESADGKCHSAGVYFDDWSDENLFNIMKERAYKFEKYAADKDDIMWNHINPKILNVSLAKILTIEKYSKIF